MEFDVLRIELAADELSAQAGRDLGGRPRAHERIEYRTPRRGTGEDAGLDERRRETGKMRTRKGRRGHRPHRASVASLSDPPLHASDPAVRSHQSAARLPQIQNAARVILTAVGLTDRFRAVVVALRFREEK